MWCQSLSLEFTRVNMGVHKALQILRNKVDLEHFCGYVTMLNASSQLATRKLSDASDERGQPTVGFFELRSLYGIDCNLHT